QDDVQWWRAKSSDTFAAVGPWIETDLDPEAIAFRARVNGEIVQDAHTSQLVFGVRECVAFISQVMTLEPGDIVYTGTPGTTAQLSAGDVVEIEAEGIGVLRNPVVAG
ncbi:MAG: fumarylacetoacetate hydrolase family protein, partial [Chloroflexota bacterium]|nr:fumarylacetoacetate hydrolase family protein [Chloroflexota bacterium]